jgi:hypothetical protein
LPNAFFSVLSIRKQANKEHKTSKNRCFKIVTIAIILFDKHNVSENLIDKSTNNKLNRKY